MKNILITGGCGFIGSNLVHYLHRERPGWHITNVDSLSYAADRSRLEGIEGSGRYRFVQADLADFDAIDAVVRTVEPDGVFHLAAETHVDNSIRDPLPFLHANAVGTFNLLEVLRSLWNSQKNPGRLLHVSTDEVFGQTDADPFAESSPYSPNNPYSAMKAASDHIVRAWSHTYGMDAVMVNCSNNYGPRQHREKLVPTVIESALDRRAIPVYGRGENVRDWLFVEDHCRALEMVFEGAPAGERYVVGARNEWANIDLVKLICHLLDEMAPDPPDGGFETLITFVDDRPGHDRRYAVDPLKIEQELGWYPRTTLNEGMQNTVRWYFNQWLTNRHDIS